MFEFDTNEKVNERGDRIITLIPRKLSVSTNPTDSTLSPRKQKIDAKKGVKSGIEESSKLTDGKGDPNPNGDGKTDSDSSKSGDSGKKLDSGAEGPNSPQSPQGSPIDKGKIAIIVCSVLVILIGVGAFVFFRQKKLRQQSA